MQRQTTRSSLGGSALLPPPSPTGGPRGQHHTPHGHSGRLGATQGRASASPPAQQSGLNVPRTAVSPRALIPYWREGGALSGSPGTRETASLSTPYGRPSPSPPAPLGAASRRPSASSRGPSADTAFPASAIPRRPRSSPRSAPPDAEATGRRHNRSGSAVRTRSSSGGPRLLSGAAGDGAAGWRYTLSRRQYVMAAAQRSGCGGVVSAWRSPCKLRGARSDSYIAHLPLLYLRSMAALRRGVCNRAPLFVYRHGCFCCCLSYMPYRSAVKQIKRNAKAKPKGKK